MGSALSERLPRIRAIFRYASDRKQEQNFTRWERARGSLTIFPRICWKYLRISTVTLKSVGLGHGLIYSSVEPTNSAHVELGILVRPQLAGWVEIDIMCFSVSCTQIHGRNLVGDTGDVSPSFFGGGI